MDKKFTILILLLFISTFWIFWIPGVRVANDYHLPHDVPVSEQIIPWIFRETNVADGLGEYTGITLWAQPLHSLFSILSALSIPPSMQTKLMGGLVFLIGFFSSSKLLGFFNIKGFGKYLGIFFYLANSYFILLFDGGQISLALVYAISPLVFYLFLKMMDVYSFRYKLYFTSSILLISILDIRFIYLLIPILFLSFIFEIFRKIGKRLELIKQSFLGMMFLAVVLISFHAYWILPSILIKTPQLPQTYERISQVDFLSFSSVGHALLLQQPHWYKNIFGQISNLGWDFIFIPILVFLAPILRRKDKVVGFWLIVAVLGVFLSKGSQNPFGQIYSWLFTHIPGFSLFRDPTKFYFYICLAYSVLIAITIQEISLRKSKFKSYIFKIIPYLILIYFVWLIRPAFLGQMTGLLSQPLFILEYLELSEYLKNDHNYSRVFWIPTKAPLGHVSNNHPLLEASRYAQKRPFAVGITGSYETLNYLREAPYMGEIFDVAGIGYIVYPYLNQRRDNLHPDNIRYYYLFLDQLSKLPWLSKVDSLKIPVLKTTKHQDRFFAPSNIWWVIGSDSIYKEATKSANLQLSKNALIFAEESPGLGKRIDELPTAKIILNNKTEVDLAASFIKVSDLIFPANQLDFEPNQSGWWKRESADLGRWRDFLVNKYQIDNQDFDLGGGWAVGEGNLKLKVKNEKLKVKKDDILLVRVMESSRSGDLKFYQDDQLIGEITTKVEAKTNIRWFEVGELPKDGEDLQISSTGPINVVNALVTIDKNEWLNYQDKAKSLQDRVLDFANVNINNTNNPKITYQKIDPTKYIVTIEGLAGESFLVFSQNYDSLWKMNGQPSLPVYSLLNGYKIDKDGQYIVEFEAQKYVNFGLIISSLTVLILILLLIRYSKSKNLTI